MFRVLTTSFLSNVSLAKPHAMIIHRKTFLFLLLIFTAFNIHCQNASQKMSKEIKTGDQVPHFTLKNQRGEDFSTERLLGKKNMVIYFYPKDETKVCTIEACSFRDNYEVFQELDCEVIGISNDGEKSHRSFAANHSLPFILLSDEKNRVRKLFGVPKDFLGLMPGRYTYVVNKAGEVIFVFNSALNGQKHVEEALRVLKNKG